MTEKVFIVDVDVSGPYTRIFEKNRLFCYLRNPQIEWFDVGLDIVNRESRV